MVLGEYHKCPRTIRGGAEFSRGFPFGVIDRHLGGVAIVASGFSFNDAQLRLGFRFDLTVRLGS